MALRHKDPRDSRKWRALRKTILARDSYACGYCGQDATTVDHILPIKNHPDQAMNPENLISACAKCNSAKGSRSQGVFLARQFTPPVFSSNISPMRSDPMLDSPFTARPIPIDGE
jgi:5-methylcytosine-specific restriction endonuclease McrA